MSRSDGSFRSDGSPLRSAAVLREKHGLLPRADRELAQHGGDVVAHRARGERQGACDLAGRRAVPAGTQHVELALFARRVGFTELVSMKLVQHTDPPSPAG